MDKEVVNRLVYSVIQFLQSQLEGSRGSGDAGLTEEGLESVEVAIQCLETAYGVSLSQSNLATSRSIYEIFAEALDKEPAMVGERASGLQQRGQPLQEATEEDKAEAERVKNEGNQLMRDERYTEALECYTRSISKDSRNAVYYCNRAAAHSKLNNQREAIEDCKRALQIEPQYSKAYGRMGLAYSSLNEHQQAKECYQKALELEPDNESYRGNLTIAEEKLQSEPPQPPPNPFAGLGGPGGLAFGLGGLGNLAGGGGGGGGPGGPDIGNILSNPALMSMATQLMSDPNMQNMLSNFMGVMAGGGGGGGGGGVPGGGIPTPPAPPPPPPPGNLPAGGMEALLTAGRQLAEQMQNQHPELVEQIRQQMNRGGGGGGGGGQGGDGNNQQPPPS